MSDPAFNSTFVLSMGTLVVTASGVCLAYALRSKCSSVKLCCGCVDIVRDVEVEVEEDRILMRVPETVGVGGGSVV